ARARSALRRRRAARAAGGADGRRADRHADRVRGDHGRHQRVQRRAGGRPRRLPGALRGMTVALITGVAHGQGRATALALAADGYDIVGLDVAAPLAYPGYAMGTEDELASLARELPTEYHAVAADVRDDAAVTAAVDGAIERFGRIDVLFNNAGICAYGLA